MQHLSTGNVGAHSSGLMFHHDEIFIVMSEYNILLNENNYYSYLWRCDFMAGAKPEARAAGLVDGCYSLQVRKLRARRCRYCARLR